MKPFFYTLYLQYNQRISQRNIEMELIVKSNIWVIFYSIKTLAEEFIKLSYIQRIPRIYERIRNNGLKDRPFQINYIIRLFSTICQVWCTNTSRLYAISLKKENEITYTTNAKCFLKRKLATRCINFIKNINFV